MSEKLVGYVVVDRETKLIDWDMEVHPSSEKAIESLTGPYQMWCTSVDEETDDRTYWGKAYMICKVTEQEPRA